MKKAKKKENFFRRLARRYRQMPRQLRSRRVSERSRAQKLLALTICVPVMLFCAGWVISYQIEKAEIERSNAAFSALYAPATHAPEPPQSPSPVPTAQVMSAVAPALTAEPVSDPTAEPISAEAPTSEAASLEDPVSAAASELVPTAGAEAMPSEVPAATAEAVSAIAATSAPTDIPSVKTTVEAMPTAEPAATPTPGPSAQPAPTAASHALPQLPVSPDRTYAPLGTANPDTVIYAMETPPPVQDSFAALLELNPETVGYLNIPGEISLPVVQRKNDNDFYLNHAFDLGESEAGTLFLDGANLLAPEDQNLLIYGHNMKNGAMFHRLVQYYDLDFLIENPIVHFDTIYENRTYVPFAVFMASMDPESMYYMDIRQFIFDETSFGFFVQNLKTLSIFDIPVEAAYGDSMLMLVTCEYVHDNGRFVIALRELRDGETEAQICELMRDTEEK